MKSKFLPSGIDFFCAGIIFFVLSSALAVPQKMPMDFSMFESRVLRLALEQAQQMSTHWDPSQRDCSGFVRFLYRQTRANTAGWYQADHQLHDYASAEDLVQHNFYFVQNQVDVEKLKTGDVLVFYSPNKKTEDRYHLMTVLKFSHQAAHDVLLVYHNGASGKEGAVRKISLRELQKNLNNEWSASPNNPRYKGVYRWQGWRQKI
ncbi:MAG: DUF1175 family protein [Bdellovibrionaceae bacterium]|nr:DUF1175 family protein [Pseudobdellovibrionaceae bacterium]